MTSEPKGLSEANQALVDRYLGENEPSFVLGYPERLNRLLNAARGEGAPHPQPEEVRERAVADLDFIIAHELATQYGLTDVIAEEWARGIRFAIAEAGFLFALPGVSALGSLPPTTPPTGRDLVGSAGPVWGRLSQLADLLARGQCTTPAAVGRELKRNLADLHAMLSATPPESRTAPPAPAEKGEG